MALRTKLLTLALGVTGLYVLGLFFVFVGSPVTEWTDGLDALRTVLTIVWIGWIAVAARDDARKRRKAEELVRAVEAESARTGIHIVN